MALEFKCISEYQLLQKIASGGMGSVYLGKQRSYRGFGKTVAVKIINPSIAEREESVQRFIDEANLVSDLVHENILQVYNLGRDELFQDGKFRDIFFIVMEFVHGKSLDHFLNTHVEKRQVPDPRISAFIASRVTRGLYYAHNKFDHSGMPLNIVHRDVTPQNVMIDFSGVVKLADFGIAKAITMNMPDERSVLMGKLNYFAPEQLKMEPSSPQTDIYSLGLILYELLTGRRVFDATSIEEQREQLKTAIVPPSKYNPRVEKKLEDIVLQALQPEADDRFDTARDMGSALEHYLYDDGYGPTNEKLADYINVIFPEDSQKTVIEAYSQVF